MSLKISVVDVQYVADLANLELEGDEVERMQRDLSAILDYVAHLNQLDTSSVEPMAQVLGDRKLETASAETLREDQQVTCFSTDEALSNAPASSAGFFKVPRIIER